MRMYDIITDKKHGKELTEGQIRFFVDGFTKGNIPDYQMSALCMAICLCGMSENETAGLTDAMAHSGFMLDLAVFGELSCDKHSTGGVGDKTTLIAAPVAAVLGCKVAKMSGRGLGHTGGTVDKLEAMGVNVALDENQLISQTKKIGLTVSGQTCDLAPVDKKLYALRDVTATVDSIPLIASSIMSKKLASGAKNIVLDVKYGSGAFMKTREDAKILGEKMVKIGKSCGRNVVSVLSDMNTPLGDYVGNLLEVREAIDVLCGKVGGELLKECVELSAHMASLALKISFEEAEKRAKEALSTGKAYDKFLEWMAVQGGNVNWAENPDTMPRARYEREIVAEQSFVISSMDVEKIGLCACCLGAGRETKNSSIDFSAGLYIPKKTGDTVNKGELISRLYTEKKDSLDIAEKLILDSVKRM